MFANPAFLLLALLLLWFPRRWMRMGATLWRRRRSSRRLQEPWKVREPGDPRVSFWEEAGKTRNWFDLLRAAVGSLAICGGNGIDASIRSTPDTPHSGLIVLGIQFAILLVGLLIQAVRKEGGRGAFFAPIFYLAGAAVGLCGIWGALFAFVLVWAINAMLPNAPTFLMVQGIAQTAFGLGLQGLTDIRPVLACLLCITAPVLSLLLRRPLVVFSRKSPVGGMDVS